MTAKGQAVAQTKITPRPAVGLLQRQCACGQHTVAGGECESCRKRRAVGLQRAAANPASVGAVPPIVHDVLRSPGQPLDPATRALMEPRFGYDFSNVRVHSDHRSAQSAQSVNALAYTVGHNVVFNSGQYAPATRQGQRLLAHELTHVVQTAPSSGTVAAATLGRRTDPAEQEAEQTVNRLDADSAGVLQVRRTLQKPGTLRRFSTAEHEAIGNRAYLAAQPQGQSAASVEPPLAISELYSARPLASNERANTIATRSYGQMVAIADNVASFLLLEQRERERARTRVPVLSGIWDWIGDNAHYVDLAARNRQHFHPHNYLSWQQWH